MIGRFASRICGSADLYAGAGKGPESSINFVTCHDGFTLNDLVSYERKHNDANGEGNRDGASENFSANHGIEGASDDEEIDRVRRRQIKNFILTLAIARGIPMLLAGDEFRRTQHGNNNAYCQDNETSWLDWSFLERHREIHQFTERMLTFRRTHPVLRRASFYEERDIAWFNPRGEAPDWSDASQRCLACWIRTYIATDLFLMFNAAREAVEFRLPVLLRSGWQAAADTAQPPPLDASQPGSERYLYDQTRYKVEARSAVILIARA
jgi:glycogen operon protein